MKWRGNIFHSDFVIRPCILMNISKDKNDYLEYDLTYIQKFAGKREEKESKNATFFMMFY